MFYFIFASISIFSLHLADTELEAQIISMSSVSNYDNYAYATLGRQSHKNGEINCMTTG